MGIENLTQTLCKSRIILSQVTSPGIFITLVFLNILIWLQGKQAISILLLFNSLEILVNYLSRQTFETITPIGYYYSMCSFCLQGWDTAVDVFFSIMSRLCRLNVIASGEVAGHTPAYCSYQSSATWNIP